MILLKLRLMGRYTHKHFDEYSFAYEFGYNNVTIMFTS